ncbi:MAG: hypothetical protein VKO01_02510 [Cyanobacteriota bacterium]|jgi:hypothetical protein|nr:hypothetical protein [Cyanobacteriota bacterium]
MGYLFWSVPVCLLSLTVFAPDALANYLVSGAPLKPQALLPVAPVSPSLVSVWQLNQVATRIADQVESSDPPSLLDSLDLPGLAEIIDNRGNLRLPLGLRVYTTLGDTSIGFGTNL